MVSELRVILSRFGCGCVQKCTRNKARELSNSDHSKGVPCGLEQLAQFRNGRKGVLVRYLKLFALPIGVVVLGLAALSATASPPLLNETINYSYDLRGRLVKVEHSGTVNNNVIANYSYDKADNRTTVNVSGAP